MTFDPDKDWPEANATIDDLLIDATELKALLEDPHPGSSDWWAAVHNLVKGLNGQWDAARKKAKGSPR